eukprot:Nk52_evm12s245 gene=Nk52_evmTU12s245
MELEDIFEKIRNHVKKNHGEFTNSHGEVAFTDDFVVIDPEKYSENRLFWSVMFKQYFVERAGGDEDDLLFFVRIQNAESAPNGEDSQSSLEGSKEEPFYALRKNGPIPIPNEHSIRVDWEKTVYLNILLHEFDYRVTVAHCTARTKSERMKGISKTVTKVYPSPSRQRMDVKGTHTEFTYPFIYFALEDFENIFKDIVVSPGECVCVELLSQPKVGQANAQNARDSIEGLGKVLGDKGEASIESPDVPSTVLFQGAVGYDALDKAYNKKKTGLDVLVNRKPVRYLMMRGPQCKGEAQMAISRTDDDSTGVGAMLGDFMSKFSIAKLADKGSSITDSRISFRSYLTYVSLSWDLIIRDMLEEPKRSVLDRMKF